MQIHLLHTWTDQWSLKSSANELSEDQNKQPTSNDSTLNKQWTEILIDDKFEDSISEETWDTTKGFFFGIEEKIRTVK